MSLTSDERRASDDSALLPLFTLEGRRMPREALPDLETPPDVAYQAIHDELMIDGNLRLNFATFVTAWMERQGERLMTKSFDKNTIDKDEYPQTAEVERRCVTMLSRLWHAPEAAQPTGCRDPDALPGDLVFRVNYLGDDMPTFALDFSRPGAQVVAQYYNFLRLGFAGYARMQGYAREVAMRIAAGVEALGPFELLTRGDELPGFAFKLVDGIDHWFDVSNAMRARGWQLPAYTFPANRTDLAALRVVVRRGFTHDLVDLLIADLERAVGVLDAQDRPVHTSETATSFHHQR
jgi:glutamate/tyrosine decarboxylase-like PLP-dependent enzyme